MMFKIRKELSSNRRNRSTVDNEFGSGDRGCPVRCHKSDEFRNLLGLVRPAQRNSSKQVHQLLAGRPVAAVILLRPSPDNSIGSVGSATTGRDADDPHSF